MIIQLDRSRMLVGLRIQETQHPSYYTTQCSPLMAPATCSSLTYLLHDSL